MIRLTSLQKFLLLGMLTIMHVAVARFPGYTKLLNTQANQTITLSRIPGLEVMQATGTDSTPRSDNPTPRTQSVELRTQNQELYSY